MGTEQRINCSQVIMLLVTMDLSKGTDQEALAVVETSREKKHLESVLPQCPEKGITKKGMMKFFNTLKLTL